MSILKALFNPSTVVDKKTYWMGGAILVVLGALIYAAPLIFMTEDAGISGIMTGAIFSIFIYLLIYPWFCLIGGRLRDGGQSPVIYIAAFVGYAILSWIITMILIMPGMIENMEGMLENLPDDSDDSEQAVEQMVAMQAVMMKQMVPKQIIASTLASILTMLPFGLLKQKVDGNQYVTDRAVFD